MYCTIPRTEPTSRYDLRVSFRWEKVVKFKCLLRLAMVGNVMERTRTKGGLGEAQTSLSTNIKPTFDHSYICKFFFVAAARGGSLRDTV